MCWIEIVKNQDVRVKVMEPNREMFGARSRAMICRNFDAAAIVFEDSAVEFRGCFVEYKTTGSEFVHEIH